MVKSDISTYEAVMRFHNSSSYCIFRQYYGKGKNAYTKYYQLIIVGTKVYNLSNIIFHRAIEKLKSWNYVFLKEIDKTDFSVNYTDSKFFKDLK